MCWRACARAAPDTRGVGARRAARPARELEPRASAAAGVERAASAAATACCWSRRTTSSAAACARATSSAVTCASSAATCASSAAICASRRSIVWRASASACSTSARCARSCACSRRARGAGLPCGRRPTRRGRGRASMAARSSVDPGRAAGAHRRGDHLLLRHAGRDRVAEGVGPPRAAVGDVQPGADVLHARMARTPPVGAEMQTGRRGEIGEVLAVRRLR